MNQSQENNDFIYFLFSAIDRYTMVYQIEKNTNITINGIKNLSPFLVKIGDTISDLPKHNNDSIIVKYIGRNSYVPTCFCGNSTTFTPSGDLIKISELKIGDKIQTGHNEFDTISHILKTNIDNGTNLIKRNDLSITPYHPIFFNDKWIFPINHPNANINSDISHIVYSIALKSSDFMFIDRIKVIGLGHNINDNNVTKHPYFGSNNVIKDLNNINPNGYIEINSNQIIRDKDSGLICKIIKPE